MVAVSDIEAEHAARRNLLIAYYDPAIRAGPTPKERGRTGLVGYESRDERARRLGLVDGAQLARAHDYLASRGWIVRGDFAETVITAAGVDEAERQLFGAEPGQPASTEELRAVEPLVRALVGVVQDAGNALGAEERADLEAQAATIEAQLRSPTPRRRILAATVASIRWTADAAGQTVIGTGAMGAIYLAWRTFFFG